MTIEALEPSLISPLNLAVAQPHTQLTPGHLLVPYQETKTIICCLLVKYPPFGPGICAVPVFPATSYPP